MTAPAIRHGKLTVAAELDSFIRERAAQGTGVSAETFWAVVEGLVDRFAPRNRALLAKRDEIQNQIDGWHRANPGQPDQAAYQAFLNEIGYIEPEVADFTVGTANVDPELATMAGPQLVVPLTNARYLLNAAYMRIQNVQLGYTLSDSFLKKTKLQNLRVYVSGENLFTKTDLINGIDPIALGSGGRMGMTYGADRIISFGINASL